MSFGILRFSKQKGGVSKALEAHHERKKQAYLSNPDIDIDRSHLNYHFTEPKQTYHYEIQKRIRAAGCKVKKDSVRLVDTIITASPEFFRDNPEQQNAFFERAFSFMKSQIGEYNIITAVVHLDEKTPHMHLCFTPITKDNRLSAKEIIGNRYKLVDWQDKFHEYMSAQFPQLERGEPAAETKRTHIPVRLFKQATQLEQQVEQIKSGIAQLDKRSVETDRDAVLQQLSKMLPVMGSYNAQLRTLENGNQQMRTALQRYEQNSAGMEDKYNKSVRAFLNLKGQFDTYKAFVDSIPDDIKTELFEKHQNLKEIHDGLER